MPGFSYEKNLRNLTLKPPKPERNEPKTENEKSINAKKKVWPIHNSTAKEQTEVSELTDELPKIVEAVKKIKEHLKIKSFSDLTVTLGDALTKMKGTEDRFMKVFLLIETILDTSSNISTSE